MNSAELEKIKEMISGMRKEDLEAIADIIPVELCHNRIGKELRKGKQFRSDIGKALREAEGEIA